MSYRTLLKFGTVPWNDEEKVIDTNARVEEKVRAAIELYGIKEEAPPEGFREGLDALGAQLLSDIPEEGGSVIKAQEPELAETNEALEAAKAELEEALAKLEEAKQEAAAVLENARTEAASISEQARQAGHDEGFAQGESEARAALQSKEKELEARRDALEAEYDERFSAMEPEFIDQLTAIYEHVFHVDLLDNREVLFYLMEKTMRDIGLGTNFLVHVSPQDYPQVQGEKERLSGLMDSGHTLEIIQDNGVSPGGCMVETDNGIFDCGIDTELKALTKKLRMLSYERSEEN